MTVGLRNLLVVVAAFLALDSYAQKFGWSDPTFNPALVGTVNFPSADVLRIDRHGDVLVGGWLIPRLVKLHSDGEVDSTFQVDSRLLTRLTSIAESTNGYFVAAERSLHLLNFDGSVNTNYLPELNPNGFEDHLLIQPDGKLLIGGRFNSALGTDNITRLNADGTRDLEFNPSRGRTNFAFAAEFSTFALQEDGRILVASYFDTVSGPPFGQLFRRYSNGDIDQSFVVELGLSNSVNEIAIQSSGRIIIGGWFVSVNGTPQLNICRLDESGGIDTSFQPPAISGQVTALLLQPDQRIIVGSYGSLVRLLPDGQLDTEFAEQKVTGAIKDIAIQDDGRILVAGDFQKVTGLDAPRFTSISRTNSGEAEITVVGTSSLITRPFLTRLVASQRMCVLESTTDFASWSPLKTNLFSVGTWIVKEPATADHKFYRVNTSW